MNYRERDYSIYSSSHKQWCPVCERMTAAEAIDVVERDNIAMGEISELF